MTRQNATEWQWTNGKILAAELLAEDYLTDAEIAEKAHVHRATLAKWKDAPEFQAKMEEFRQKVEAAILKRGIASRLNRVRSLDDRRRKMHRVIDARAADASMQGVPGGDTGLLVHNVKSVGSGPLAERVDLYEVDTGLLKELRSHEKQAAQELGQWVDKIAPTSPDGTEPYVSLTDQQLTRIAAGGSQGTAPTPQGETEPD